MEKRLRLKKVDAKKMFSRTGQSEGWLVCLRLMVLTGALLLTFHAVGNSPDTIPSTPGWHSVPASALETVCPPATEEYDFRGSCKYVVAAWNGGIADTKLNRLLLWGGGHADYAGNELYAFDVNSLQMQRLNEPSPINSSSRCVETLSDDKPNSRHTYSGLAYIAHAHRMFSFGGGLNRCGFFSNATWTLDLDTLQWKNMKPEGGAPSGLAGVIADYDLNSHSVFLHDTANLWQYDYDRNRYKKIGTNEAINYHMNGVIDPKRKLFFMMGAAGSPGGGLKVISVAPGSDYSMRDWSSSASATCGPLLTASSPGLSYDSVIDRIVGWPNFGDRVYLFDPDSKTCTSETFSDGPPDSSHQGSPHTSNGTFGRFRYFPDKDVFVLVNQAGNNVYTLRLSAKKVEPH